MKIWELLAQTQILESHDQQMQHRLSRLDQDEDQPGFAVLDHDPSRHSPERPLVIIIHPGDMIENPMAFGVNPSDGWWNSITPSYKTPEAAQFRSINQQAMANQAGAAKEVNKWRSLGADVVVLHRGSCSQFDGENARVKQPARTVCWDLELTLRNSWNSGSVLFGDDLKSAVAWMVQHLHIQQRPKLFFAGAYSGDNGCLTYVVDAISRLVPKKRIRITKFAPDGSYSI